MSNLVDAKYVSIWDDGRTEVWSDVVVDFDEMRIVEWNDKWYEGEQPVDDGDLDHLDEEKVITPFGIEYTAVSEEYDGNLEDCDNYGNGAIVYSAE